MYLNAGRTLVFVAVLFVAPSLSAGELDPLMGYSGDQLFQRFCASCHGRAGYGDGPVAPSFKVMIPDLTRLAQRSGGRFPARRVVEIIDGRAVLPAHGTRPMPVWGYEFEAQAPSDQSGRAAAQTLINRLADHIRSMQQ
ncbi:MAG: cytochrome c [Gammaproteobacteria bacterium]|nr:cytochrome c [Gammaproteobacteria bacterium]